MIVGLCTVELYLPDSHSLKAKRQVLLSLKDRLRDKFNVSVAEGGDGSVAKVGARHSMRGERAATCESGPRSKPERDQIDSAYRAGKISQRISPNVRCQKQPISVQLELPIKSAWKWLRFLCGRRKIHVLES